MTRGVVAPLVRCQAAWQRVRRNLVICRIFLLHFLRVVALIARCSLSTRRSSRKTRILSFGGTTTDEALSLMRSMFPDAQWHDKAAVFDRRLLQRVVERHPEFGLRRKNQRVKAATSDNPARALGRLMKLKTELGQAIDTLRLSDDDVSCDVGGGSDVPLTSFLLRAALAWHRSGLLMKLAESARWTSWVSHHCGRSKARPAESSRRSLATGRSALACTFTLLVFSCWRS